MNWYYCHILKDMAVVPDACPDFRNLVKTLISERDSIKLAEILLGKLLGKIHL